MKNFKTEARLKRITDTVKARQYSLSIVVENVHDPHNVSAVMRTCDAVGIPKINLLYNYEKFPKLSRITSASAKKWIDQERYTDVKECFTQLRKDGFKIYSSALVEDSVDLYDLDLTEKVAIVLGNEHRGVSDEVIKNSDKVFKIPMFGMVQSLNISVANAVILYEAMRQRRLKGMYDRSELSDEQLEEIILSWCEK